MLFTTAAPSPRCSSATTRESSVSGLGSGALFVDLTNTGRLDLYASNCTHGKDAITALPSKLFRNDGGGKFTDVSQTSGTCPPGYAGRGLSALDFDGDGLLDLLMCERYYGAVNTGPALYRNKGGHQFEGVASSAGLPEKLSGLGVAAADLNGDTWPDVVLTEGSGDHRIYLNDGKGKFKELTSARQALRWDPPTNEDSPAGVAIGDVNRDGLPDIVIGHHYKQPWRKPEPIRLYLHRGIKDGNPTFEDITSAAGLEPIAMKAPHVEIQDFDNDGLPDIYVSIVKFKGAAPHPLLFRNTGSDGGVPRFKQFAWAVNDYPNADDLVPRRSGQFFEKLLKDRKIIYMAPGPTCDYDRDGRLDMFLPTWWNEDRSLLLRNESPTVDRKWLDVIVEGSGKVNRMGIGSRVDVFPAGKLGDAKALIGSREIVAGFGYCSGQEAAAHFGLGAADAVDVRVTLPHDNGVIERKGVKVNQRVTVKRQDIK